MEIKELGHVVLYVRDLERSARFYGEVLGFREIGRFGHVGAAFSGGRTHHELLLLEVGEDAPGNPPGRRAGLYHIGFKVGDSDDELREVVRDLQAAGVRIHGATDHHVTHSLYIQDPDGNELELYVDVDDGWKDDPSLVMAPPRPLVL